MSESNKFYYLFTQIVSGYCFFGGTWGDRYLDLFLRAWIEVVPLQVSTRLVEIYTEQRKQHFFHRYSLTVIPH